MPYPTLSKLRRWANITDSGDDDVLDEKLAGAVAEVENYCGRTFLQDSVATARTVWATDGWVLNLPAWHDISTTTDLVVKTDGAGDGTFETTWTISTDFVLEPLNGVGRTGPGHPSTALRAVGTRTWARGVRRPGVQITAKWGWAAVPGPVSDAVLLVASESWKLKEAPFGVAGFGDFGVVRVRDNPVVARKLDPYVHGDMGALIA